MVLRILTDPRIINTAHLLLIKEVIHNRADQHLKGCGGADARRSDHLRGNIGVKAGYPEAGLPCSRHHTSHQRKRSLVFRDPIQFV